MKSLFRNECVELFRTNRSEEQIQKHFRCKNRTTRNIFVARTNSETFLLPQKKCFLGPQMGKHLLPHATIFAKHLFLVCGRLNVTSKRGNNVADKLLRKLMLSRLRPQETFVAEANFASREAIMFLIVLPQQMFPRLRTEETFWEAMFPQQVFLVCGRL